jgi:hypothetical protein
MAKQGIATYKGLETEPGAGGGESNVDKVLALATEKMLGLEALLGDVAMLTEQYRKYWFVHHEPVAGEAAAAAPATPVGV